MSAPQWECMKMVVVVSVLSLLCAAPPEHALAPSLTTAVTIGIVQVAASLHAIVAAQCSSAAVVGPSKQTSKDRRNRATQVASDPRPPVTWVVVGSMAALALARALRHVGLLEHPRATLALAFLIGGLLRLTSAAAAVGGGCAGRLAAAVGRQRCLVVGQKCVGTCSGGCP
mmetsp:Transcript_26367/g.87398  ORF Transcript_26367/g.87398 Transcript_26367/m.87398 type:complete len:171 (-) Transcript_26367:177-689(-)